MPPKSKKNKPKPVKKDGEDEVMASGSSSDSEGEEITMNVDETAVSLMILNFWDFFAIFQEIQNVEFEGFPPIDGDIEGISRLLPQLLLQVGDSLIDFNKLINCQAKVDIHALSRTIARQELIGCVLRPTEESAMEDSDEDVYGILTALPLHHEDVRFLRLSFKQFSMIFQLTSVLEHFRKRTMKHKATDPGCKELHTSYLRKVFHSKSNRTNRSGRRRVGQAQGRLHNLRALPESALSNRGPILQESTVSLSQSFRYQ